MGSMRKDHVEGLRGIAAVLVVLSHFMIMLYPASFWNNAVVHTRTGIEVFIGSTPLGFVQNGNTGVMIFLVITGAGSYWLSKTDKKKRMRSAIFRPLKLFVPMLRLQQ